MMKRIWMFFLIFLLAFANTDEWIVMEEPASVHTQDENAVKKRFLERVVEKESVVVMVRGKVHTSTPAVRKNRVKIYFYFLLICFFYLQAKRSRKGDVSAEIGELFGISYSANASVASDGWKEEDFFSHIHERIG